MSRLLSLAAPLFAVAVSSLALPGQLRKVFYVDAVSGNDNNNGTSLGQAWLTLQKASQDVPKDSTILVLPGTYKPTATVHFGGARDQSNCQLIGVAGPTKTIIDGGGTVGDLGVLRIRHNQGTQNFRISGFTFQNIDNSKFWSMAIRMGSTSGGQWMSVGGEVDNCIFNGVKRGMVIFGAGANNSPQSSGNRIHDNLFIDCLNRVIEVWGDGTNYVYNNTIVGQKDTGGAGIYFDSIIATATSKAIIYNNLVANGNGAGIQVGTNVANNESTATVKWNNCFKNATDYAGFQKLDASNTKVDPQFVDASKGNYRLKTTSPLIDAGTAQLPTIRYDLDNTPHNMDYVGNGRKPDIGAFELSKYVFSIPIPLQIGTIGRFQFAGPSAVGLVLWSLEQSAIQTPFGTLLIDILTFQPGLTTVTTIPGQRPVAIPNIPPLKGLRFVLQGASLSNQTLDLLQVYEQIL